MWNIFKKKNAMYSKLKDLTTIVTTFDLFKKLGVVLWRRKDKILLIEESLALLKLKEGREGFLKFLNQAVVWQNIQLINEAYDAHRLKVETEAVRKAQKQCAMLTKADLARIRQQARADMQLLPLEKLDYIKEFDIFIIRAHALSAQDADKNSDELLAVGHYNGKEVEMAMYEDIKLNLQSGRNEQSEK